MTSVAQLAQAAGLRHWQVARIQPDDNGCWIWHGSRSGSGYGVISRTINGKPRQLVVHRMMYEAAVGPIADGLELDHLCRARACCNPAHLEAVPHSVNVKRGLAPLQLIEYYRSQTHCRNGHPWAPETTGQERGRRICIPCRRARGRRKSLRSKAAA